VEVRRRGRVKIGSRNIFFDCDDWTDPVVRIPVSAILAVHDTTAPPIFASSPVKTEPKDAVADLSVVATQHVQNGMRITMRRLRRRRTPSLLGSRSSVAVAPSDAAPVCDRGSQLSFAAKRVIFQREHGLDHPYVEAALGGTHVFTPLYSDLKSLNELVVWLRGVAAITSRRDREKAINAAVSAREASVPFDIAWLENGTDERTLLDESCAAVYALSKAPGRARITSSNIYLMPIHGSTGGIMRRIAIEKVVSVRRMRHGILDGALEIGYEDGDIGISKRRQAPLFNNKTLMVAFQSRSIRERAVVALDAQAFPRKLDTFDRIGLDTAMTNWRSGKMSNFEYLLYLNLAAGRSFNDLSQYPVFPWVVTDFTSSVLDMSSPDTFRDLSLPIGAINAERLAVYEERYREMPPPQFFYGTHYSTPAYVINYLVRAAPAAMIRLQNGRFDTADRLFNSMADAWRGVCTAQADVKELTPEFYTVKAGELPAGVLQANAIPGEFLDNVLGLDLGTRQDGKRVEDVELPAWAQGKSSVFVARHREALESMHVSCHIHMWIDLIFGVKARDVDSCNVFYTDVAAGEAMDDGVATDKMDEENAQQLETVLLEFGRTPDQLFLHPHPARFGSLVATDSTRECHVGARQRTVSIELGHHNDRSNEDEPRTIASRTTSLLSVNLDRPLSITVSPGCAFLNRLPSDENGFARLSCVFAPHPAVTETVFIVDMDAALSELDIAVVTVCSDGYMRVFVNAELRRSRFIDQHLSSVACGNGGLVFLGVGSGNIWVYNIGSGRSDVAMVNAHDSTITALCYSRENATLVSASKDAMIRVWSIVQQNHGLVSVHRLQELDAEDAVVNLTVDWEGCQLFVAALTSDGNVIAWSLTLRKENVLKGTTITYPVPIFQLSLAGDVEVLISPNNDIPHSVFSSTQRICWVGGASRRRMLATAMRSFSGDDVVRLWRLDVPHKLAVEILVPGIRDDRNKSYSDGNVAFGAVCILRGVQPGTLLVGGHGWVSEFDRTGLSLQKRRLGSGSATILAIVADDPTLVARLGFESVVAWGRNC
jgi:factor associated with neutral sphingomyelinase activation